MHARDYCLSRSDSNASCAVAHVKPGFVYDSVNPDVSSASVRDGFAGDEDMDGGVGDLSYQSSDNLIKANFE